MESFDGVTYIYSTIIDVNETLERVRFFLGDRWVDVGKMEMVFQGRYAVEITMPDVEAFFDRQAVLDNGSEDWLIWGSRMN